jgi:hypothetical protein
VSVIRWENPPPRRKPDPVDWAAVGEALYNRPGEWAHVGSYGAAGTAGTVAYQISAGTKHSSLLAFGRFEAESRTVDGEHRVYARYVGEPS